jgi:hypothetical protein
VTVRHGSSGRLFVIGGLLVAIGLALFLSPLASGEPDGLNRVALDQGFADSEREHRLSDSPVAGYGVRGVDNEAVSTGVSGVIGVLITFGVGTALFGLVRRRAERRASNEPGNET